MVKTLIFLFLLTGVCWGENFQAPVNYTECHPGTCDCVGDASPLCQNIPVTSIKPKSNIEIKFPTYRCVQKHVACTLKSNIIKCEGDTDLICSPYGKDILNEQ